MQYVWMSDVQAMLGYGVHAWDPLPWIPTPICHAHALVISPHSTQHSDSTPADPDPVALSSAALHTTSPVVANPRGYAPPLWSLAQGVSGERSRQYGPKKGGSRSVLTAILYPPPFCTHRQPFCTHRHSVPTAFRLCLRPPPESENTSSPVEHPGDQPGHRHEILATVRPIGPMRS
jgi:hypothetical protein